MDKQAQSEPAEAATTLEHRMLEILQNMEVTAVSQDDALERVELLVSEHQHPSILDEVTLQLQVEEAASSSLEHRSIGSMDFFSTSAAFLGRGVPGRVRPSGFAQSPQVIPGVWGLTTKPHRSLSS